jgi:hypothetical protein
MASDAGVDSKLCDKIYKQIITGCMTYLQGKLWLGYTTLIYRLFENTQYLRQHSAAVGHWLPPVIHER